MTRDALAALGAAIRDAVAAHVPRGHQQVDASLDVRGVWAWDRATAASLGVRVGDWHAHARVALAEHDPEGAARACVAALRARIEARRQWHETMTRACDAALAVMDGGGR